MDDIEIIQNIGGVKKGAKEQSYNYSDQELIRQLVKSRMAQNQELEYENLDGYVLPPRTQLDRKSTRLNSSHS